jgi:DNA-binding CsgD family transcriptional regulator
MARRTPPGRLSDAELRVLTEIARGGLQREVATRLTLSESGVRTTLRRARRATGATTTAHLVAITIRNGQLPADVAAGTEVQP